MTDRLVDSNGFPRSDIDLVAVTTARSNIIRLKNDHKAIMLEIEQTLHAVHAEALAEREKSKELQEATITFTQTSASTSVGAVGTSGSNSSAELTPSLPQVPFAKVNAIAPDSPAKEAGLLQGDMIVAFGPVSARTPNALPSLSEHVQTRENKPILVKVLRNHAAELQSVILVPRQGWGGRGMLGCHIVPA
ncbi:putative 26S proteasome regulatory subunit [Podila humilis]|nr:putative 26S proteasome regulatory subunit [Podila humilis]